MSSTGPVPWDGEFEARMGGRIRELMEEEEVDLTKGLHPEWDASPPPHGITGRGGPSRAETSGSSCRAKR